MAAIPAMKDLRGVIGGSVGDGRAACQDALFVTEGDSARRSPIAVRVLSAKPAVEEEYLTLVDIVAEAEAAEAESPLAITTNSVLQLEDVVVPSHIGRVLFENVDGARVERREIRVLLVEAGQEGLTARRNPDRKPSRHAL
jgi:hypothetical protein